MKHPPPKTSLESLKKEQASRTEGKSPLPELHHQVSELLPDFISNFSAFNGKPEYGTFHKIQDHPPKSPLVNPTTKKVKISSPAIETEDLKVKLKSLSPSKWNEIGKKFKNLAQENSSRDLNQDQLKLGAIYFLSSCLSYLQGSVVRDKDFLSEFNSSQELLNVTISRLNKYGLTQLLSLLYLLDATFCMYAIDFAHKKIKACKSKIESLLKISKEENVTSSISEQESSIKSCTESILKFSESSIRKTKDSSKICPEFYEKYSSFGPLTLFSPVNELSLTGILILVFYIQENQISNFINLWNQALP